MTILKQMMIVGLTLAASTRGQVASAQFIQVDLDPPQFLLPNIDQQPLQQPQFRLIDPFNPFPRPFVYGIRGVDTRGGVRVTWVERGSMAARQGIEVGDTIAFYRAGGRSSRATTAGLQFAFGNGLTTNLWIRDWRTGRMALRTADFGLGNGFPVGAPMFGPVMGVPMP